MLIKTISLSILLALGLSHSVTVAKPPEQVITVQSQNHSVLDINTADADALSTLPGIGIHKAEAIIEYREKLGRFKSIQELLEVKGIGNRILAKLEGKIKV
ncbi:helix-hairpin-helix domain-containing protein [Pseudoalteromonas sp. J010]|uniref:ComEA family DNA-binding protein n=1 Tax=Pseudoalteromonas sp. J010 TaxID=998465 RepID=UPI000F6462BE|nr:helix-hairpin-helix domain-containing protein [Pseudoalteromonas sp. J010]RRS07424.1 helix-hairpin-helix domain-containing protein [Pseudoalteromonas sp. J010]